jgi:holliday junction DNA helicase RuvA
MIARITGRLESVESNAAMIALRFGDGEIVHEVLVPAVAGDALAAQVGQTVRLETMEYLEPQGQGSSFIPRLVGFRSPEERDFFDLLTTVKGLGTKRALRAMAAPADRIARAIEDKDAVFLRTLPEVGKRLGETIIAELSGKVERFLSGDATGTAPTGRNDASRQAMAALVQLGESRADAEALVARALASDPDAQTADAVLALALSLRS